MLREVFRTALIPYMQQTDPAFPGFIFGFSYGANTPPYVENIFSFTGLTAGRYESPNGPTSIYIWTKLHTSYWPSWGTAYYRFDAKSGKFIKRIFGQAGNLGEWLLGKKTMARSGAHWGESYFGDSLLKMSLGPSATASVGDEPEDDVSYSWPGSAFGGGNVGSADIIPTGRFKNADNSPAFPFPIGFHVYAIDDMRNRFIHGFGRELGVWELTSGVLKYKTQMPDNIAAICLEDDDRCYILLGNRTLITYDYMRGEILGAVKVPSLLDESDYYDNQKIAIAWDVTYRRLLVVEETPNDPATGASTMYVRGYRLVPIPVRLTTPIPLRAPRQGRQIPVLVQAVGDMNEGVSGYQMTATVSGAGMLIGVPVTDHQANALIQVLCAKNDNYYDLDPGSVEAGPDQWNVQVVANARYSGPDDTLVSGQDQPSGFAGGPSPGPPNGGTGIYGANQMPDMKFIVDQVFGRQTWRLAPEYAQDANGRGAFTAACVQAMHDRDARFGHFLKLTPSLRYLQNDRALDAVCYKNADGVTQEGATIVIEPGVTTWRPYDRSPRIVAGDQNSWVYP